MGKKNEKVKCKYQKGEDGYFGCSLKDEDCLYAFPCGYFLPIESCPTLTEKEKIKKIIVEYLEKHKDDEVYPSDIAFDCNLDARKVFDVCQELKREGKIV